MAKAMRQMEDDLKLCDAVILVLDARAPASSYNPKLEELLGTRPILYVFNKSDLSDSSVDKLISRMRESGRETIKLSALDKNAARQLGSAMEKITAEKAERLSEKGVRRALRFFVAGVPNTGKSTLINLLVGGKRAQVGDKAGVTKTKQWVRCGSFELMDTPGTMPPYLMDQSLARRLAYLGCINDDILEPDEIALSLLSELKENYFEGLKSRYGVEKGEPLAMLEGVCKARGFLLKGGELDFERGERTLIDDFRKGKLGRVCFDSEEDLKKVNLI